jgi:hypothetical protein
LNVEILHDNGIQEVSSISQHRRKTQYEGLSGLQKQYFGNPATFVLQLGAFQAASTQPWKLEKFIEAAT